MSSDTGSSDIVIRDGDPFPDELLALEAGARPLMRDARARHRSLALVSFALDPESKKQLAKRRHDVKAALRTLGFTVKALETGYRFDDDKAKAKIDAIAKAVQLLDRESELLMKVLSAE